MVGLRATLVSIGVACVALVTAAQAPTGPIASFTTSVAEGGRDSIRIDILRWSTDAERDQIFLAWTQPGAARDAGGKSARPAIDESDPANAGLNASAAKGKGKGGAPVAEAPKPTSERSLAAALAKAETIGHLWSSSEVAGYSIRYAARMTQPEGERVILITDRRLGAWNDSWKPAAGAPSDYDFSLIELRLTPKGEGEGKASLAGKVAADSPAKLIALENYASSPVIFKSVRRRSK